MAAALAVLTVSIGFVVVAIIGAYASPGLALLSAPLVGGFGILAFATLGVALRRPRRHGIRNYASARA
jgi:hypothetical protein